MRSNEVIFEGIAWPAVREEYRREAVVAEGSELKARSAISVAVVGRGRSWHTSTPRGFWRTFAALDVESSEAVLGIYARYGDPNPQNFLNVGVKSHTLAWPTLQANLSEMVQGWDPPDRNGISRPRKLTALPPGVFFSDLTAGSDDTQRPQVEMQFLRTGYRFTCKTLWAFMATSAIEMWLDRTAMRQCDVCGHWYGLQRATARVCSATCRNVKSKEARHGARS